MVTGLTFIFSDLFDVDDLLEISGQVGRVKGITMRFVELENALGARVFVPNRTVNNVINYPKGYIRCIADVTLIGDMQTRDSFTAGCHSPQRSAPIFLANPPAEVLTQL